MRNFSNIYIPFLFVTLCWSFYDMSFVRFCLHSEVLLNLAVASVLDKCKVQAKACNKKVNA